MNKRRILILVWLFVSMGMMVSTNETVSFIGAASCGLCVFTGHYLCEHGKI